MRVYHHEYQVATLARKESWRVASQQNWNIVSYRKTKLGLAFYGNESAIVQVP